MTTKDFVRACVGTSERAGRFCGYRGRAASESHAPLQAARAGVTPEAFGGKKQTPRPPRPMAQKECTRPPERQHQAAD